MKRTIVALLIGGMVFGTVLAAAATLNVNGGVIQAGNDSDLTCDSSGVDVLGWGLNSGTGLVENVRIGNVSAACAGAGLQARIQLSSGPSYITGPLPAGHTYEVTILASEPAIGYRLWFKDVAAGGALVTVPAWDIVGITVYIEGP
jgi:hypothetical protein